MDTTVPVLAVISGDTDTIRQRRDAAERELAIDALCIGRDLIAGIHPTDVLNNNFWRDELVKDTERFDLLAGECRRRHLAVRLAHADYWPRA